MSESVRSSGDVLVVVLWANSADAPDFRGRPFETLKQKGSANPLAWQLSMLQDRYGWLMSQARLVYSPEELTKYTTYPLLHSLTREAPLLIPVGLAQAVLGWQTFDIWEPDFRD